MPNWISAFDLSPIEAAANRRLSVMFNPDDLWPMNLGASAGDAIAASRVQAIRDAYGSLVPAAAYFSHDAGWGQLSLQARWLYPQAGADENKTIVRDSRPPGAGEVGFFAKLNGHATWTGGLAGQFAAAVHLDEPTNAADLLSRGRYLFRAGDGGSAAASKDLPEGLWYPPAVARDGADELHSWFGGGQWLWPANGQGGVLGPRGRDVTVRSATLRLLPQGANVKLKLYHCLRAVDPDNLTWANYAAGQAWATPGGTGAADATLLASLSLTNNAWTEHAMSDLAQQMFDGDAEPTFMIAPDENTGWPDEPTHIQAELSIDFELG